MVQSSVCGQEYVLGFRSYILEELVFPLFRLEESLVETGECPTVLDILPKE
jgi:hypothetical protein